MPKLRNGNNGDSNPGSLDCESGILPTELPRSTSIHRSMHGLLTTTKRMQYFALREFVSCPWCWVGNIPVRLESGEIMHSRPERPTLGRTSKVSGGLVNFFVY